MLHCELVNITVSSGTSIGTATHTVVRRLDDPTPTLIGAYVVTTVAEGPLYVKLQKSDWESTRYVHVTHRPLDNSNDIPLNVKCVENDKITLTAVLSGNAAAERTITCVLVFSYGNLVEIPSGEVEVRYLSGSSGSVTNLLPEYDYYPVEVRALSIGSAGGGYVTMYGSNSKGLVIIAPLMQTDYNYRGRYVIKDTHVINGRETITWSASNVNNAVIVFVKTPARTATPGAVTAYKPSLGLLGMGALGGTSWKDTRMLRA